MYYIDLQDFAMVSFVVFTAQLTYSIVNGDFGVIRLIVLGSSFVCMSLTRDPDYVTDPKLSTEEQISFNKERVAKRKRFDSQQVQLENHMDKIDKIVAKHTDLLEKYNDLLSKQKVDNEPMYEQFESTCDHDYDKYVLGREDNVMRCMKCAHSPSDI
jgi:hypothetical protein